MSLLSYHYAWLAAHPERSELWLREHLLDGFHIHHIDGNRKNESPRNLVLIDGRDHLAIHGIVKFKSSFGRRPPRPSKSTKGTGRAAYEHRRDKGQWLGFRGCAGGTAYHLARAYARESGLPWPLPSKRKHHP